MNEHTKKINFSGVLKGIAFSILLTIIFLLILTAVCYFSDISDKMLSILIFAASVISVFGGAFAVARNSDFSGILHGLLLGLGYFIILLASSIIINKGFFPNMHLLSLLISCVCSGMLGGIFGINTQKHA